MKKKITSFFCSSTNFPKSVTRSNIKSRTLNHILDLTLDISRISVEHGKEINSLNVDATAVMRRVRSTQTHGNTKAS